MDERSMRAATWANEDRSFAWFARSIAAYMVAILLTLPATLVSPLAWWLVGIAGATGVACGVASCVFAARSDRTRYWARR